MRPSGDGIQGTLATTTHPSTLLPGLPPIVVLLQQPLHLVANPAANGIEIKATAALAGTTSGHPIDELAAGLDPSVQPTVSAVFHALTLPTPATQPALPSQSDHGDGNTT